MKAVLALFAAVLVYATCAYEQVKCPPTVDPGKDYALIAHPCNCSSYFMCYGGIPTAMPCFPGLHWNNEKKYCDWPPSANCKIAPECDL